MTENKEIKKAMKELEEMSEDEELRRLAELKEKAIRDEKSAKYRWTQEGIKQGIQKGIKQGIEQIVIKMKQKKLPIDIIMETTGLTKEEIDKI